MLLESRFEAVARRPLLTTKTASDQLFIEQERRRMYIQNTEQSIVRVVTTPVCVYSFLLLHSVHDSQTHRAMAQSTRVHYTLFYVYILLRFVMKSKSEAVLVVKSGLLAAASKRSKMYTMHKTQFMCQVVKVTIGLISISAKTVISIRTCSLI